MKRSRQLKPVQDAFNRGKDLEQQALKNLKEQSKALNDYNAAVREFKAIQHEAERLTRSRSDDKDFTAELDSLSQQAHDELINCLLSQASIYTTRGSFNQAMGKVGEVLAMDSQNQQALNMRARIEIAANSDSGYLGVGRVAPSSNNMGEVDITLPSLLPLTPLLQC